MVSTCMQRSERLGGERFGLGHLFPALAQRLARVGELGVELLELARLLRESRTRRGEHLHARQVISGNQRACSSRVWVWSASLYSMPATRCRSTPTVFRISSRRLFSAFSAAATRSATDALASVAFASSSFAC